MRLRSGPIEDIRDEIDLVLKERGLAWLLPVISAPYTIVRAHLLGVLRLLGRRVWWWRP